MKNYLTFTCVADGTIKINTVGTPDPKHIMYRINGGDWIDYTDQSIECVSTDQVQFWSDDEVGMGISSTAYRNFSNITGQFDITGNIMSLVNFVDYIPCDYCFYNLFYQSKTTTTPELPATVLTRYCYVHMFYNCTSLVTAPELPATILADNCYAGIFHNCTSLVNAPELPATTLADYCYASMFSGCTSLVNAPELPATILADNCYELMFQNCTSLVNAPELPAKLLEASCYSHMFNGCTSLQSAVVSGLGYQNSVGYPCDYMFSGCTNLQSVEFHDQRFIPYGNTTTGPTGELIPINNNGILDGCNNLRTIKLYSSALNLGDMNTTNTIDLYVPNRHLAGWTKYITDAQLNMTVHGMEDEYLRFDCIEGGTIGISVIGTPDTKHIMYRINGGDWVDYTDQAISASVGDYIEWWSDDEVAVVKDIYNYRQFTMTGKWNVSQKLTSLINFMDSKDDNVFEPGHGFSGLFKGCSSLINAKDLILSVRRQPTTDVYNSMFRDCTNLVSAPAILNFSQSSAFPSMFNGCTSLTEYPYALYPKSFGIMTSMFSGCTSLTKMPILMGEIGNAACQNMFGGCSSLTKVKLPKLNSVNGEALMAMFISCTNLQTVEIPILNITGSLVNMLNNCSSLKYVKCDSNAVSIGIPNQPIDFYAPNDPDGWATQLSDHPQIHVYPSTIVEGDQTPIDANAKSKTMEVHITDIDYDWKTKTPHTVADVTHNVTFNFTRNIYKTPRNLDLIYHMNDKDYHVKVVQSGNDIAIAKDDIKKIVFNTNHEAKKMYKGSQLIWEKSDITAYITGDWVESTVRQSTREGYITYMSDKYKGVNSSWDRSRIYFLGTGFTMSYTSYAESSYDFLLIGPVDVDCSNNTNISDYQYHTQANQNANVDNNTYKVAGLSGGWHFIDIAYIKDSSSSTNDDRAYVAFNPTGQPLKGFINIANTSNLSTNSPSLSISNLTDNNINTKGETWPSYVTDPYIQIYYDGPNELVFGFIPVNDGYMYDAPKTIRVDISDDETNWNTAGSFEYTRNDIHLSDWTLRSINIQSPKYVRFVSTSGCIDDSGSRPANPEFFGLAEFGVGYWQ